MQRPERQVQVSRRCLALVADDLVLHQPRDNGGVMVRSSQVSGRDRRAEPIPRFAELSVVALQKPVEVNGRLLPAGTRGTVVAAYTDGIGYEVEFFEPFHAVVTLEANDLGA